jgi:p-hydroxybenzoate 3-monooxygenase
LRSSALGQQVYSFSQLLSLDRIESIVLETKSRAYVESRIRAGVLEHGTVQLLCDAGVSERLKKQGMRHEGINLGSPV